MRSAVPCALDCVALLWQLCAFESAYPSVLREHEALVHGRAGLRSLAILTLPQLPEEEPDSPPRPYAAQAILVHRHCTALCGACADPASACVGVR